MAEMSLREQIRAMEDMEQDLKACCQVMNDMIDDMNKNIASLRGEGFTVEKEADYRDRYFNPAKDTIDMVIDNELLHIRYLVEIIEDLEGALRM